MKTINLLLIAMLTVFLVGCGTKNLPATNPVVDTPETDTAVVDTDADEVEEVDPSVDEANGEEQPNIIDTLKERNDIDKEDVARENVGEEAPEADFDSTIYVMDTEESSVNWKADRVLSAGHYGTVTLKEGTAIYINSQLSSATAVLDMTTIASDAGDGLDGHLKNEDFFDVENYPEATIVITSTERVEDTENGDYAMATADLTIKGITNEVVFPVYNDEYRDIANITIDRTLWDIKYGSEKFFDDLKDKAIKDEIEFEVNIAYE